MNFNLKWILLAVSMAALGGWACGSDSKGGGSNDGSDICDDSSPSYDEAACKACDEASFACFMEGTCGDEFQAAVVCAQEKCGGTESECAACESKSLAYANCFKRDCPAAAACM